MFYPAQFEAVPEGGFVVTFRDIPEAITQGDTEKEAMEMAVRISDVLFTMDFESLSKKEMEMVFEDAPTIQIDQTIGIIEALHLGGLVSSNRQARELINNGSVSVNNVKVDDIQFEIKKDDAYFHQYAIIKKGKKSFVVLSF